MLTVKHIDPAGSEVVFEASHVSRLIKPMQSLDNGDSEAPPQDACSNPGVNVTLPDGGRTHYDLIGHAGWTVYVMNRFGATVATYRL